MYNVKYNHFTMNPHLEPLHGPLPLGLADICGPIWPLPLGIYFHLKFKLLFVFVHLSCDDKNMGAVVNGAKLAMMYITIIQYGCITKYLH